MATRKKGSSTNGQDPQRQRPGDEQERLVAQLSERAGQLAEHADDLAHRARQMGHQADLRFRQAVDRRPMTAVWTGFGLGLGLGLALVAAASRGRDEDWSVGGWSPDDLSGSLRDLSRRVESLGRSAAHDASGYAHDLGDRAAHYARDLGESATRRARDAAGFLGF